MNNLKCQFTTEIQQEKTGKDFRIRGTAINAGVTRNNIEYLPAELQKATQSLKNKVILKNHDNSVDSIVGVCTDAWYNSGTQAVEFEGIIEDEKIRDKIQKGLLKNVSIGAFVKRTEKDAKTGAEIVYDIEFVELSLVAIPADGDASFRVAHSLSEALRHQMTVYESTKPIRKSIEIKSQEKQTMQMSIQEYEKKTKELDEEIVHLRKELDKAVSDAVKNMSWKDALALSRSSGYNNENYNGLKNFQARKKSW